MAKPRALVVDNEKLIVELLAGILEGEGYSVTKCFGGLEALELLKQESFDIVFLDLVMPRIGGDRICRYIKQAPEHSRTRVVIVSAVAIEAENKIAELKADACIAKAAFPRLKENVLRSLALIQESGQGETDMILGAEGVSPRTVVQELLFAQRHFEAVLNSMGEAVIELDTDHVITYANPSAQKLLGKQEWELIGRVFSDGFPPDRAGDVKAAIVTVMKSHSSITEELIMRYTHSEFCFSFTNVIRDGVLIGVTVVVNDLTEKKMLENERMVRERLTGVVEMAGAAAHELNQPLAVISGHAQLLLKDSSTYDEKLCRRLRIILDQIERLGQLTERFTGIVAYRTKDFGKNIKIVDIEKSSKLTTTARIKGIWD